MPFKFCRFLLMGVLLAACSGSQVTPTAAPPTQPPFHTPTPMNTAVQFQQTRYVSDIIFQEPIPAFVAFFMAVPDEQVEHDFCILLEQEHIVEPGDHNLHRFLYEVTRLYINDLQIHDDRIHKESYMVGRFLTDGSGNVIASYGGPSSFCMDSSHYATGIHTMRVETRSTQGREFEFEWDVEIGLLEDAPEMDESDYIIRATHVPTETASR